MREGNLDAPTRHPIEWRSPEFHDEQKLDAELERVFDICHGCRRCVSLCTAFPTLFDLIDAGASGEIDGVDKKDYVKVVDQCYLCDVCYMTKCPYVPPHQWNVDFPHLMLRAKAVKFKKGGSSWRDRVLSSTDALGRFAGIPIVTQTVNTVNQLKPVRAAMESLEEKLLKVGSQPVYRNRLSTTESEGDVRKGSSGARTHTLTQTHTHSHK